MNKTLVWQLAFRYLRGKRSANAVPILSRISMTAIMIGSCAMIILFSVFNGFEFLVRDLYKAFYPEIRITMAKGKFFSLNDQQCSSIKAVKGVGASTGVLEDYVLIDVNDEQRAATIKGIDKEYFTVNGVKPYIEEGVDSVTTDPVPTGIFGAQLLNQLGLEIDDVLNTVPVYYPNAESNISDAMSGNAYQSLKLKPVGAFRVQDDFDSKYILAPLDAVQELLRAEGKLTSIEIKLKDGADADDVKSSLQSILGKSYIVETRYEQNRTLYMVMHAERWAVYAVLLLVLLIASFNMVGALSLLVLEKQKDMAILKAMGAGSATIKSIFIAEGVLWSLIGGLSGLLIGTLVCVGQQRFHWIKMGGSFIIDAYPVSLVWTDYVLIIATIMAVGLLAAWMPAARATRIEDPSLRGT